MSSDDLMISLVVAGFGLTTVYFYVAYILWRKHKAAALKNAAALRNLHAARVSRQDKIPVAAPVLKTAPHRAARGKLAA
jgi:hypothetical protein